MNGNNLERYCTKKVVSKRIFKLASPLLKIYLFFLTSAVRASGVSTLHLVTLDLHFKSFYFHRPSMVLAIWSSHFHFCFGMCSITSRSLVRSSLSRAGSCSAWSAPWFVAWPTVSLILVILKVFFPYFSAEIMY